VALVKVGAVPAGNRGAAVKAIKIADTTMADVRAVQLRILLDGTWQEWFSIDRESGSAIERVLCQVELYAINAYVIRKCLGSVQPDKGLDLLPGRQQFNIAHHALSFRAKSRNL